MTKFFKITNHKDGTTTVSSFETKREAQAGGNSGYIVSSMEELSENFALTLSIMRDAYNVLNPDKQVSRFSDRESACRRLWSALEALGGSSPAKAAPEKAAKPEKASKGQRKGSRREIPVAVPSGKENPYRVATASHKAFELAADNPGLTFNQLVAKGGRANTLAGMMKNGLLKPVKA